MFILLIFPAQFLIFSLYIEIIYTDKEIKFRPYQLSILSQNYKNNSKFHSRFPIIRRQSIHFIYENVHSKSLSWALIPKYLPIVATAFYLPKGATEVYLPVGATAV